MTQRTVVLGLVAVTLACAPSPPGQPRDVANPARNETAPPATAPPSEPVGPARLQARPRTTVSDPLTEGLQALGLAAERDGTIYVPPDLSGPAGLVVMLHGAGGEARKALNPFLDQAGDEELVLLAVDSRERTWDMIVGGYGPDVAFLDQALERVFAGVRIDPQRIAIEGFSDGASYALSLGLSNGDLFDAIVAFSPGFAAPDELVGQPRIFVSHGTNDRVLPVDRTSRQVVPRLEAQEYDVRYEEFAGGHEAPPPVRAAALQWLTSGW